MPLTKEEREAAASAARAWPKGYGDDSTWAVQRLKGGQYIRCTVDAKGAIL